MKQILHEFPSFFPGYNNNNHNTIYKAP